LVLIVILYASSQLFASIKSEVASERFVKQDEVSNEDQKFALKTKKKVTI